MADSADRRRRETPASPVRGTPLTVTTRHTVHVPRRSGAAPEGGFTGREEMVGFVKLCEIYSESAKFEGESRGIPLVALDEHWQFLITTTSSSNPNPPSFGDKYSGGLGDTIILSHSLT
ncbi:hypothetical protein E2C01_058449 [Portunus trituberculatus]|uniref:Uncharacterized protein n=1 Tax=Portunus trituberculatus TaxID=210409 RepID=A0A5B7H376_PORTR|nr:hypothetical protein [Portunus trituberculatus]